MTLTLQFDYYADHDLNNVHGTAFDAIDSGEAVTFENLLKQARNRVSYREYDRKWPNVQSELRMSDKANEAWSTAVYATAYRAWLTLEEYATPTA